MTWKGQTKRSGYYYRLVFLSTDGPLNTEEIAFVDSCPPLPDVGEVVILNGDLWKVKNRTYAYHSQKEIFERDLAALHVNIEVEYVGPHL